MRIVAIIQARMGSSRLPGKVLRRVGKQTVLTHVLNRAKRIPGVHEVCVATTTKDRDDPIVNLSRGAGVRWVRGDEADVLSRYVLAAQATRATVIVRLTSDCPLLDPRVAALVLDRFLRQRDKTEVYVSNVHPPTWYDGCDIEVFSATLLRAADKAATPEEREHVTTWMWRGGAGRIENVLMDASVKPCADVKLSIDTRDDLDRVRRVYAALADRETFGWRDVLDAYRRIRPAPMERRAFQLYGSGRKTEHLREAYLLGASGLENPYSTDVADERPVHDAWMLGQEDIALVGSSRIEGGAST